MMRFGRGPKLDEFTYYDDVAAQQATQQAISRRLDEVEALGTHWADPVGPWLDNPYDSVAQEDVYLHVRERVVGGVVLQLGGTGKLALECLAGGASKSFLATPVTGEAEAAMTVAEQHSLADRLTPLICPGEAIELEDESVDVVISGGCLHHTTVPLALQEARRVLRPGGLFGAWDPWHARLYDLGTSVFGKRERGIECRPLNPERLAALTAVFPDSEIRLHGALTRYPLIAMSKFGVRPSTKSIHNIVLADDRLSRRSATLRRNGSSCAVLARK